MNKKEYLVRIWFEKASNLFVITADKQNKKNFVATQSKTFIGAFEMLGDAILGLESENQSPQETSRKSRLFETADARKGKEKK
jgi:hypothetical protein